ncbi:branched-chain amino acid ABC transporter permease, partial [Staphylococcus aureus]
LHFLPLCQEGSQGGRLAGSMAVDAGLTFAQSIGMSAIIFAGAAQLVTLGLVVSGAGMLTIIVSVFFITAQHLLYGLTLRPHVAHLKWYQRIT